MTRSAVITAAASTALIRVVVAKEAPWRKQRGVEFHDHDDIIERRLDVFGGDHDHTNHYVG
jgi:hypothetical protein